MSHKSVMRKAHTKVDIKWEDETKGAGLQLTKVWRMRYHDVMVRFVSLKTRKEILYFDRQKVFAEFGIEMDYRPNITTRDRVHYKGRIFFIKMITNFAETNEMLLIALEEKTND